MPGKRKRGNDASKLEGQLGSLTPSQIREELRALGESVGPIDASNKDIYVRMLARKKIKVNTDTGSAVISVTSTSSSSITPSSSPTVYIGGTPSPRVGLVRKPLAKSSSPASSIIPGMPTTMTVTPPARSPVSKKKTGSKLGAKSHLSDLQSIRDFKLEGLTAATFTPFNEERELNLSVISKYVDWLLECGVKNVFLNGTTGESMSLTVEERKILVEKWIEVAAGRLTVIVHVGTENLKYTCELAEHAQEAGAQAIGVMPTTFFKPSSMDHLILYLKRVADSAPRLPMYYYHIPSMTGVNFSMEDFLETAGPRLPTLRGLKYTSENLMEFGRCVTAMAEKYQIIYGSDQQVIGALALGGTAAIGSTYNYAGKLYNRLFSAYKRRDTEAAKLEQRRSQAMIKLLFKYGSHAGGGKAFMQLCGVDCGPPRLPVLPLSTENMKSLAADLHDIGYYEWS